MWGGAAREDADARGKAEERACESGGREESEREEREESEGEREASEGEREERGFMARR